MSDQPATDLGDVAFTATSTVTGSTPTFLNIVAGSLNKLDTETTSFREELPKFLHSVESLKKDNLTSVEQVKTAIRQVNANTGCVQSAQQHVNDSNGVLHRLIDVADGFFDRTVHVKPLSLFKKVLGSAAPPPVEVHMIDEDAVSKVEEGLAELQKSASQLEERSRHALKQLDKLESDRTNLAGIVAVIGAVISLGFAVHQTYQTYQVMEQQAEEVKQVKGELDKWHTRYEDVKKKYSTDVNAIIKLIAEVVTERPDTAKAELDQWHSDYVEFALALSGLQGELKDIQGTIREKRGIVTGHKMTHTAGALANAVNASANGLTMMFLTGFNPIIVGACTLHISALALHKYGARKCDKAIATWDELEEQAKKESADLQACIDVCATIKDLLERSKSGPHIMSISERLEKTKI